MQTNNIVIVMILLFISVFVTLEIIRYKDTHTCKNAMTKSLEERVEKLKQQTITNQKILDLLKKSNDNLKKYENEVDNTLKALDA
jgi:uncharacterized membrane protein YvbJ